MLRVVNATRFDASEKLTGIPSENCLCVDADLLTKAFDDHNHQDFDILFEKKFGQKSKRIISFSSLYHNVKDGNNKDFVERVKNSDNKIVINVNANALNEYK